MHFPEGQCDPLGKVCVTISERVQLSESIAVVGKKRARFSDLPPFLLKVPFQSVTILSSLENNPLWTTWDGPLVKPQYDQDWGFAYLLECPHIYTFLVPMARVMFLLIHP